MRVDTRLIFAAVVLAAAAGIAESSANPIEVGTVEWRRDFDAVVAESARTGKPVFAFFQEVPGCGGCQSFGSEVMSYPAIVEAVESEFVPVLIYNNRPGADAELLKRYGEPAWNYQVVRFLDGQGKDLIPRKDGVWDRQSLARRMIAALDASGRTAPEYLAVVAYEDDVDRLRTAAFAQHCFWTGEFELGRIPGVITTEAGWIEGREATLVRYHADLTSLDDLVRRAAGTESALTIYLADAGERARVLEDGILPVRPLDGYKTAKDADQKRQIRKSAFERLNLSPMQRTKVNSYAPVDMDRALAWLTPAQREEFMRLSARGD